MLQRIQSIYLFLASLAIFALFLFPLVHNVYVDNKPTTIMVTGTYQDVNGQQAHIDHFVALTAVTGIAGIIPLIVLFLYKNRKQQIAFCYSAILLVIGYSFWIAQSSKAIVGDVTLQVNNFGIGMFLCPVAILLLLLAIKGIQRDEKLIKSADRLR
ncbi:MAG: hypothetical protein JWR05_289 [Mucilaginibacter sp.]|nr:hypothetical protein [Mucilaginibacter sp.]